MPREPGYCHHRPTDQAYVRLGGKIFYLGRYGSDDSRQRYAQLKAQWLADPLRFRDTRPKSGPTMAVLALAYLEHAKEYYLKREDQRESTEYANLRLAIEPVSELYALLPVEHFGPGEFKTIQKWWLARKSRRRQTHPRPLSRVFINRQMKRLLRMVRWGVSEGMVPPSHVVALQCVPPLKRGRTTAPETKAIRVVDATTVEKTLKHCPKVVADMVRFQQLVGCRPGELVRITPRMVDRGSEIWEISFEDHKTAYLGKDRRVFVGPKAQKILARYLLRDVDSPCFSPSEAMRQRRQAKLDARVTPLNQGNRPGSNRKRKPKKTAGIAYTTASYRRAIAYACKCAKIDPWGPNRLRHSAATEIRKRFGLEAASSILGHSEIATTQIYAEKDRNRAIEVAKALG